MRIILFSILFLTLSIEGFSQCFYDDSTKLAHFYIDTLSKESSWHEFETDSAYKGYDSYISNQKKFFDSLGVISFDQTLKTACDQRGFVVYFAILKVSDNKSKTVWELEGKSFYKFGGRGPGNATVTRDVLTIDATTGVIISQKKRKTRAMVDF